MTLSRIIEAIDRAAFKRHLLDGSDLRVLSC
jgi:hypothetical protein